MNTFLALKTLHLLGAAVLLGTGAGIAYFQWTAYRSRDLSAIRVTTRRVVRADWLFTTPAVLIQPATGIAMMSIAGHSYASTWFAIVSCLYLAIGACWIPVVVIQARVARVAAAADSYAALPAAFHRDLRRWFFLGVPAFAGTVALFVVMVFRPGMG